MKFHISQHAQVRYKERVHNNLNTSDNLLKEMLTLLWDSKDITNQIYDSIPRYILYLYHKYGSANYQIRKAKDIIFLCKKREGTYDLYVVITCWWEGSDYLSQFKNSVLSREEIFLQIKQIYIFNI